MSAWWPAAMCAVLFGGLVTAWAPGRWANSIIEVGAFGLVLGWLIHAAIRGQRWRWDAILIPPAMFLGWGVLQYRFGWTAAASETASGVLAWGAYLSLTLVGLQVFGSGHRERFVRWLLALGCALCVIATLQRFTSESKVFWMFPVSGTLVMGPFLNHSHYAALVELLLPLALVPAVRDPARRVGYSLIAGGLLATLVASGSRGGFIIAVIETVVVIALCAWKQGMSARGTAAALAAVLALGGACTAVVGWDHLETRFRRVDLTEARLEMLRASADMIRHHGALGVGLGNWPTVYPRYAYYDDGLFANQAHNDWAQWTAEAGIAGAVAALILLGCAIRIGWRTVWCAGPLFVLAHASFDYPFQKIQIAALVFVLLAAGAAAGDAGRLVKRP